MMDDFIKNGIVKKEEVLTVKDYPMGFFDLTSDTDQVIKFTYKEAKEELALDLKANEKTPVFFDEKLESVKIVSPNPDFKNATIKVEKHTKIESGDITKGLYKVSFTDEIKPGKVAFQSEDKNAIIVKLSKYGNVEPLSFAPHEKTSLRTEDVTLMAGDKILVDKATVKVVDTVQENIDALDKDKEK